MSITQSIATRLRYCQEILAVCGSDLSDGVKYNLIFEQDDSEYNEWVGEVIADWEDYEGSDEELMKEVFNVIEPMERDYLTVYNRLKELGK